MTAEQEDPTAPARGCLLALALVLYAWAVVLCLLWLVALR